MRRLPARHGAFSRTGAFALHGEYPVGQIVSVDHLGEARPRIRVLHRVADEPIHLPLVIVERGARHGVRRRQHARQLVQPLDRMDARRDVVEELAGPRVRRRGRRIGENCFQLELRGGEQPLQARVLFGCRVRGHGGRANRRARGQVPAVHVPGRRRIAGDGPEAASGFLVVAGIEPRARNLILAIGAHAGIGGCGKRLGNRGVGRHAIRKHRLLRANP